ncbi:MAG: hydrogenase 4 subunit B [Mesoaciditoga sp.]|uniref:proton-conducting transporter transmembrane domain-containing protein n=1 Tax=Athalassotoga sp. TaxID=2022597 RepID=UPI000CBBBC1C|nr:MAG: hydrogenase 4 subunit B [Mesoaciditoga sp.]PMP79785.1 MAG: hydrogenase 4 subunit B [Mesoaciditoga sp.]HEU24084.1 hydrogenase 4 subunit F [Mesoaciditoga lauensis]
MNYLFYSLPMIASLIGAFLCFVKREKFEEMISIIFAAFSLISAILILFLSDVSNSFFFIDGISKIMLIIISMIYTLTVIFSTTFLKYIEEPLFQKRFYYLLLNLFAFSMFFSVSVNNFGLIWVGIEATTVTSALLIAVENDESSIEATWRYIIIVSSGLVISFIANILIYAATGTLDISTLLSTNPTSEKLLVFGSMMAIVGYGTKAGIFPMHTWLPDVHGKAPAPVSAIFSGVLLPVALYAIIRVIQFSPISSVKTFALVLGFLTVIIASSLMAIQIHYKRLFAYSTMENMGMALIGISLGGYALLGVMILIISHAFAKSSTFFLSGNLFSRYKTTKIDEIKGVSKRMPSTAYALLFSAMAITGMPPFGTFFGEIMIILVLLATMPTGYTILLLSFLALAFISLNFKVGKMIFSNSEGENMERKRVGTIVPIIDTVLSLLIVFFIPWIEKVIR